MIPIWLGVDIPNGIGNDYSGAGALNLGREIGPVALYFTPSPTKRML